MKERPILYKGSLVRAILAGQKTVTRRVVKPQFQTAPVDVVDGVPSWDFPTNYAGELQMNTQHGDPCPYGKPGDRLWVRETWGVISHDFDDQGNMIDWTPDRPATPIREMPFGRGYYSGHAIYRADGEAVWTGDDDGGGDDRSAWKPSIHMPRAASRILLEITDVRVERLQDISADQCRREGYPADRQAETGGSDMDAWLWFRDLWQQINGPESFGDQRVWVVEFKRVTP